MSGTTAPPALEALQAPEALLARERLHAWLRAALPAGAAELESATVGYVRAKRGRSLMLGLELGWRTPAGPAGTWGSLYLSSEGVEAAAAKAATLRRLAPPAGPDLAVIAGEAPALFLAFPNDRLLRGLPAAADPRRLGNRLHGDGFPYASLGLRVKARGTRVVPLRWKPGRRAVLRADLGLRGGAGRSSRETIYLRAYPARALAGQAARWREADTRLPGRCPHSLGLDVERGLLAVSECRGTRPSRLDATLLVEVAAALGLDRGGVRAMLPPRGDEEDLAAALRPLADLAAWEPGLGARVAEVRDGLTRARPAGPAHPPVLLHGDLGLDQVLVGPDGLRLLDWDEAAAGDPHADLASLATDAALRGACAAAAEIEEAAARALGPFFRAERWRWHLALARARRVLAPLQAGAEDWRARATRTLESACEPLAARRSPPARPPEAGRRAEALRQVLDLSLRPKLVAARGAIPLLAAVWPEGEGFIARLEPPARPGTPSEWLRWRHGFTRHPFPADPGLPRLAALAHSGRHVVLGHRLGRRAALAERGGSTVLHLRPAGQPLAVHRKLRDVALALAEVGVAAPRPLELLAEGDGWHAERCAGVALEPERATIGEWRRLGQTLALAYRATPPPGVAPRGLAPALEAAGRQIELARDAGGDFGEWLHDALEHERARLDGAAPAAGAALVHGDLHPGQVLLGEHVTLLDWERAGTGDPEEDLGNVAAHLYFLHGSRAVAAFGALRAGHAREGGTAQSDLFQAYARIALLRVLALHSLRDRHRSRCLELRPLWERWPAEARSW